MYHLNYQKMDLAALLPIMASIQSRGSMARATPREFRFSAPSSSNP
jgi:hypothetical protein